MKSIFILFFISFSTTFLLAQTPCSTEYPVEMENWLKAYKANNPSASYQKSSSTTLYVPIVAHIVGDDNGLGYYRSDHLQASFYNINDQFADVDIFFYLKDVNYINNTSLYEHTGSYNTVMRNTKYPDALNMYFVLDPSGACGYFSGWTDIVAIRNSCGDLDNTTIAHEIGHYMSLPHTFYGWENRDPYNDSPRSTDERVSGSNCSSSGDYFCDTPADFISDRWNCPYNNSKLDYAGDPYQPDGELYMSYANDNCQNYFSNEQIDAMRYYLQNNNRRTGHLGYIPSNFDSLGAPTPTFPANNGNYKPPLNHVELRWEGVEGADYYSVLITQGANPNFFLFDTIVKKDSAIVLRGGLPTNYTLRWKVAAFHEGNTKGTYCDYQTFSVNPAINFEPGSIDISPETCVRNDGGVSVSVNGIGAPFNYVWSNGDTTNVVNGLMAGRYQVTITSSNSETLVVPVDVPYQDIEIQFQTVGQNQNELQANIIGGLSPYTYEWSNNTSEDIVELNEQGNYSVTVTDALGCSVTDSYENLNTSIEKQSIEKSSFVLYPNPVSTNSNVYFTFSTNNEENYNYELIDLSGRKVVSGVKKSVTGLNKEQVNLSNLSEGLYILRVQSKEFVISKKLYVY